MELSSFTVGQPYRKLNLEPFDTYDENTEALEAMLDGEYDYVVDAAQELDPRVGHEIFRQAYVEGEPAVVGSERVEHVLEVLDENADRSRTSIGKRLFEIGYTWRDPFIDLEQAMEKPYMNQLDENLVRHDIPFPNPFRHGKDKRQADKYYRFAAGYLFDDMRDWELEIE